MDWYTKYKADDARQLRAYARELALRKGTVEAAEQIAQEESIELDDALMVVLLGCSENACTENAL